MKKINLLLLGTLIVNSTAVFAQSKIKDGTISGTSNLPVAGAIAEFESNNKGVLLPRVALTATNIAAPLPKHVAGMLVYNTDTAGTAPNNVIPGFYYNNGAKWMQVVDSSMQDLRLIAGGGNNHITRDAGTGGTGTTVGTGTSNIAIGKNTFYKNTSGSNNIALGTDAFSSNTTGTYNTAIGTIALKSNSIGTQNNAIGYRALETNTTGNYNSAFGVLALYQNTTGSNNTALGIGASAGNITASGNVSVGAGAGNANKTSSGNVAVGYNALTSNTAAQNTGIGYEALKNNGTGTQNVALGAAALLNNQMGSRNTAIGYAAGPNLNITSNTLGNNTLLGANTGGGITTGTNNTILGANVAGLDPALSNNIIIADGAGNQRINVLDNGNTGIGTATPQSSFDVRAKNANATTGIAPDVDAKDGILVPRVQSLATNGSQNGQLLYLTQQYVNTTVTPNVIYKEGFYHWRTDRWQPNNDNNALDLSAGGTLIAVDGKVAVAQEVAVLLTNNQTINSNDNSVPIKDLTNEIIDNKNTYTGSSTGNSFTPEADGTYLITINVQGTASTTGTGTATRPVIGLWDNSAGKWVARTNTNVFVGYSSNLTLITAVPLSKGTAYSFSAATSSGYTFTIAALSTGTTGDGPVSFFNIRRVR